MASPQLENGYSRISNEILEQVAASNFNGGELRILLMLWRQTYGYGGRKKYAISISKYQSLTGMSRQGVIKTLKSLQAKNVIRKVGRKEGTNEWQYNKDSTSWTSQPGLPTPEVLTSQPELTRVGNQGLPKLGNQGCLHKRKKKILKKHTVSPDTDSRRKPLTEFFLDQYRKIRGTKLVTHKSDHIALANLLKKIPDILTCPQERVHPLS